MKKYLILGVAVIALLALLYNEGKQNGITKAESKCKSEVIIQTKEVIKEKNDILIKKEETRKRIQKIKDSDIKSIYDSLQSFCEDCSSK